jgi:hypothetical protein
MALVVKDRVKEVTTTTGTADLTLGGAVYGFQSFAIIGNGNTTYYAIYDSATGDWEVGIGTYTTAGPTLTRTTVFESSNSGSKVVFGAGTKDVFVTYPAERSVYLDAAGSAVTLLDIGTLGVSTANITTANITAGTISTTPTNNTDIVNKQYADAIASGIHFHEAVGYATTAALPAVTYSNGTGGVGATLTANANGALTVDGYTFVSPADNGTRILIKNQADGAQNGVYTLTQAGNSSPGAPFILTRATDFDSVGTGVDQIDEGDFFLVTGGTANANTAWVQQTPPPITIGTTAIVFQQFSAPITYTAGTGLSESPSYTFNIANIGTAGTYGTASQVPVFVTNAQGQVTSVTNTGIAISAGAVSGLAPSATTDTTNAANITSGTLPVARLSGSYTGITGVGTLAAGTWNASTIGVAYGGTGITSYTVGDLLYADGATSLAKLADVATGNALISGGVGTAPAWGKIGLQTHVSGTLQLVNGGTGATDASGARSNLGLVIGTDIPSVTGSGASGTWGINITGNAATATTSTTSTTATQVSNSVTFNNSGAGAASGNGFNGSGALTVSYNTIGAPSTTGTNASGTWGISISGNAATATNSTTTSQRNFSGDVSTTGQGRFTGWYSGNAATGQAVEVGMSSGEGYIIVYDRNTSTYGTLNLQSSGASLRLTGSTVNVATGALQQGGNQVLHAGNYNSYAPTLTGGGASGTWGINITGSAGSAGSVDYNNLTNKTGGTGTYTTSGDYRAPIFYDSDNTGYYVDPTAGFYLFASSSSAVINGTSSSSGLIIQNNSTGGPKLSLKSTAASGKDLWIISNNTDNADGAGRLQLWNNTDVYTFATFGTTAGANHFIYGAYTQMSGSARAPIFYDSDNTGYYLDPASTSALVNLNIYGTLNITGGNSLFITAANGAYQRADSRNESSDSRTHWYGVTTTGGTSNFRHAWYDGAAYFNITASGGQLSFDRVSGGGYVSTSESFRAPIFYDSNNTGYYVDAASTSVFNRLNLVGFDSTGRNYSREWIEFPNFTGLYSPNNGAHFYPNNVSSYGSWVTQGSRNSWGGIYDNYSGVNGIMYDSGGNGGAYREGSGRWYFYYHLGNDCMGIGTSGTSSTYSLYLNKGVYAQSRIDATIYYDQQDTSYYLNPNSTSSLHSATCWSTWYFRANQNTTGSNPPLQAYSDNGSGAIMAFHRGGYYAVNMGLDSDNVLRIGGWSAPANLFQMDMSGNLTMAANVTAYSDERLKKDWSELPEDFVERLAAVKNGTYTRTDANMRQVGVGAQSLQELLPEAVLDGEYLSVAYGNAALAACVELAKSVVALRAELNALRAH